MRAIRVIPAALVAAGLLTLVLSIGVALADGTVNITESNERYAYTPDSITVALGDTVTWKNTSDAPHTVTADDGSFDHGSFKEGASVSQTFSTAGTYAYHCTIHSYMNGTVVVLAAGQTPPATDTVPIGSGTGTSDQPWLAVAGLAGIGTLAFGVILLRRRRSA